MSLRVQSHAQQPTTEGPTQATSTPPSVAPASSAPAQACHALETYRGPSNVASSPAHDGGPSFSGAELRTLGAAACANLPVGSSNAPPADLSCMVSQELSHTQYYRSRHDDFVKRNPGREAPPYYLEYGEKYARAFTSQTYEKLSPQGKEWLQGTLRSLQTAIEDLRERDPAAFAALERDPAAFKQFCFDSHVAAYLDNGLMRLPLQDLAHVALTPDFAELLDPATQQQIHGALVQGMPELMQALPGRGGQLPGEAFEAVRALLDRLPAKVVGEVSRLLAR